MTIMTTTDTVLPACKASLWAISSLGRKCMPHLAIACGGIDRMASACDGSVLYKCTVPSNGIVLATDLCSAYKPLGEYLHATCSTLSRTPRLIKITCTQLELS